MKRLRPLLFGSSLVPRVLVPRVLVPRVPVPGVLVPRSLVPRSPVRFFSDPKIDTTLRQLQTDLEKLKAGKKESALIPQDQIRALGLIQHRLRREILLSRQKTALGRLWVRFKWLMIRDKRPFNTDDITAMFSWILWGHILWIVLGTTTFISLLLWTLSTFKAQDQFATLVANIITRETGLRVVFEEAALPDWKQRLLVFRKVFVSKRPGQSQNARLGSQKDARVGADAGANAGADAPNYTQFDLTIDSVAVSISAWRWLAGKGIVRTAELKGVRGVIDRRGLVDDPSYDPREHRRVAKRGGFDFESFKIDDMLVDVQFQNHQTKASIFTCELPKLRSQWLLYDFLNADRITGCYDNSLFTLNPRQDAMPVENDGPFERVQRLRVDDVDVRNLNRGVDGMFGWIESGTVDFLADIMLPSDTPEISQREKIQNIFQHWESSLLGQTGPTPIEAKVRDRQDQKAVYMDLRVQFNNTRAAAPLYTRDLTYLNNALIHPIIAYLNSRDTYIPVHCRIIKKLSDFEGSWTIYDSGLMQDLSQSLYEACSQNAADEEARRRRIRKVGFWSLQFLAQLVLLTLGLVA